MCRKCLLDVDTRTSAANLTRVKVDTNVGKLNGLINVSIFKDNVGGLTTELKSDLLEVGGSSSAHNVATSSGRASEGNLLDSHVGGNVLASLTVTRDNVKNTRGETNLLGKLCSVKSGEGSGLGGLQNNGVTSGKGRANLPRKHEQRKVPGNNLATDTNGLSADVVKVARARVNNITVDLVGPTAVVSDTVGR